MTKKENKEEYQKPELNCIDDPAFNDTGQGASGCSGHLTCPGGKICYGGTVCSGGAVCPSAY